MITLMYIVNVRGGGGGGGGGPIRSVRLSCWHGETRQAGGREKSVDTTQPAVYTHRVSSQSSR